jgi:hypothetical protein
MAQQLGRLPKQLTEKDVEKQQRAAWGKSTCIDGSARYDCKDLKPTSAAATDS